MSVTVNPLAAHHLPVFITPPGETDTLLVVMAVVLIVGVLLMGGLFFWLHSLPERRLHGTANKRQFELVAVLALLALFTHNNIFWVMALVLALIDIPDFTTPLESMSTALKKMAVGRGKPVEDNTDGADAAVLPQADRPNQSNPNAAEA